MAQTLLNIKDMVEALLGSDNGATPNVRRDKLINRARAKYYSEANWSFTFKSTTISITNQVGTLPTDLNNKSNIADIYSYVTNTKYQYTPVRWSDVDAYATANYVYGLNAATNQIKINQTTVPTLNIDYFVIPADASLTGSEDSTAELAPDITAIAYLATAYWFLGSRQMSGKFQQFKELYDQQLAQDLKSNTVTNITRQYNALPVSAGYNNTNRRWIPTGYIRNM